MEHFREHGELYKDFSFFSFIRLHYFTEDDKDGDYDRDMQLPFKTNAGALLISNSHSVTLPLQITLLSVPVTDLQQHFNKFYSRHIPHRQTGDIFQPPRFS